MGQSLPLISSFWSSKLKNIEISSKKINSEVISFKATNSKLYADAEALSMLPLKSLDQLQGENQAYWNNKHSKYHPHELLFLDLHPQKEQDPLLMQLKEEAMLLKRLRRI